MVGPPPATVPGPIRSTARRSIPSVQARFGLAPAEYGPTCYTPDIMNGETATISYRTWDTTYASYGIAGTTSGYDDQWRRSRRSVRRRTPRPPLIVNDVNDDPVLMPAAPSARCYD